MRNRLYIKKNMYNTFMLSNFDTFKVCCIIKGNLIRFVSTFFINMLNIKQKDDNKKGFLTTQNFIIIYKYKIYMFFYFVF